MKIIAIQRFNKAGVLMRIKSTLLVQFFDRFKTELLAKGLRLPCADSKSEGFCTGWAGLFDRAKALPLAMVDAVLAIEEQVTPENWARLEASVLHARCCNLWLDTAASRESLALGLWLWCPYRMDGNLKEVEAKIESGRKVWEEQRRIEEEREKKRGGGNRLNRKGRFCRRCGSIRMPRWRGIL